MRNGATGLALMTTALGLCLGASEPATTPHLPSVCPSYRVKLDPFVVAPTRTAGLIAKVRINSGPPLRLLLDSGADYAVLNRKAALKSACTGGADLDLIGPGVLTAAVAKRLRADTLQIGDLTLRGVPMLVADRSFPDGVEGVLPLSVFAGFLIRLDIPGKSIEFLPYPAEPMDPDGALTALASNQLLFVRATVNDSHDGYFLLDTGAWYTAISRNLARELKISETLAQRVSLEGGGASIDAPELSTWVRLRLGSRPLPTGPVVAVDLSTASRYHSFEVAGLIGYTTLRQSVLTVNYRDGLIRVETR
jgi:hypothetical protein